MTWFINLATRTKLTFGFGLIMLFLLAVIGNAYVTITAMQQAQKSLYEREFGNAVDLKDVRSNQNAIRAEVLAMMLAPDRSGHGVLREDMKGRSNENAETMKRLIERNRNDSKLFSRLEQFDALQLSYHQTREANVIPLINDGKVDEAKKLVLGVQDERDKKMRDIADDLVEVAGRAAQAAVIQSGEQAERATT